MRKMTAIIAVVGIVMVLSSIVALSPSDSLADGQGFSFECCQAECRRAYGGYEWAPPALTSGSATGYNNCLLRCERMHYKILDSQMNNDLD